jgi:hypothetical protein
MKTLPRFFFLIATGVMIIAPQLRAADSQVTGTFKGDGKAANLAFVSAHKGEPLADKETIMLVFTEKDHSKDKRPDIKASFGSYGSALIITAYPDGEVVGCDVAHEAHQKKPFSSAGSVKMSDFKIENGQIQGKISTGGQKETFGQTWEVDLTFKTKTP